ncbi:hypothetical protein GIB67_015499 [Kingdonia uniflora]|uniref:DUF1985 domain-containing protein n=1 Tax=Kingdonia uniflora TaxID=39325 RepID=A0A7J7LAE5_9MAGN|nr:hypothetical protein GIB67_015499 [Kingdonia uniflora]
MKSDKEVNEQVDEENQTQEGRAKKGTSNAKNYTSRCTGLGLHKIFAALPEEENGALRATCIAPLLLIDPIATMSTLVVEIFDRHLGNMKFQFGEMIIQMKPIHVYLILGLRVSPIANEFLFVDPEHMTNFRRRRFPKKKNTYGLKEIDDALKQVKLERHQEDVLRLNLLKIILSFILPNKGRNIWVKYVDLIDDLQRFNRFPWVVAPVIGSSSSATEIRVVVVRVCSQLEDHGKMLLKLDDHGKMLHTQGKMLERISMSTVEDSTLPLGDTLLLGQYQFSTPEKTTKRKREGGNEKEYGKMKKAELRIKKGKGEWQKKAEEADAPNKKEKVKGPKKEALTDEQFDLVPLIQLKGLIPKIPKKGLANKVPRKRRVQFPELHNIQSTTKNLLKQVAPRKILEVANALMVDDDVEVGREVNFNTISSEYGGDLLDLKKGEEKDNYNKKNVKEKVKSKEEEVQETMVVAEVAKADIVFFNQKEVVGEAYQASADQTTAVFVEEQTLEVNKTEDEASQTKESKEEMFEGKDDDDGNLQNKPDPEQVIKQMAVDQTNLVLMESEVDVTLKKRSLMCTLKP